MWVNPIVFYEVLLNSTIDKVYEFNDVVLFYNIIIPGPFENPENVIIIKVIKKGNVAAMFINGTTYEEFDFEDQLISNFGFMDKDSFSKQESESKVRDTFADRKDTEAIIAK